MTPSRILMVTPYPPVRDGIAAYAVQQVKQLRAEGHDVEVLSPGPSAAHYHLHLQGWRGPLALAKRVRAYDKVIVQYHPDVFYPVPSSPLQRAAVTAGLIAVMRAARDVEVRVHEINYDLGRARTPDGALARRLWRMPDRIVVHTAEEQRGITEALRLPAGKVELVAHGEHFVPRTTLDRAAARQRLGLDPDAHIFLSIGFIQPHKGFLRSISAFNGLASRGAQLHVVGSVRVEEPAYVAHLEELRALAAITPGAHVHAGYLSDEAFDLWLVAADTIVLPYQFIWSSGVMERARLYDRPVIATQVGGLGDQAAPGAVLVEDDDGLAAAMEKAVAHRPGGAGAAGTSGPWPGHGDATVDRDALMEEIRSRAAAHRVGISAPSEAWASGQRRRTAASAILRRVPRLATPPPASSRASSALLKRLVAKLTAWQIQPIVDQINVLHDATVAATEERAADPPA